MRIPLVRSRPASLCISIAVMIIVFSGYWYIGQVTGFNHFWDALPLWKKLLHVAGVAAVLLVIFLLDAGGASFVKDDS